MKNDFHALVIDDDEFVLNGVTRQLTYLGVARIATAIDGVSARGELRRQPQFDLIVCDLLLPEVDGIELLRDIAEMQPDAAVILISGMEPKILKSARELAQARKLHVLGSIEKPVTTAGLKQLLDGLKHPRNKRPSAVPGREISPQVLRAAMDAGEIDIYVQPKVETRSGRVGGVEALARWLKPGGEVVGPDQFIGVAESSGLMTELTDQILDKALALCGSWNRQGVETRIAVNVPITALDDLDLPEKVSTLAQRHGVHPRQLIVEVTETGLMQDVVRSLDVLTRLRLRGVALAIDDFGTGYSSLKQLKRLPFSELKIDRSFISLMVEDSEAARIVRASVDLAHDLRLTAVAEGVETAAERQLLAGYGCDLIQGWLFAKAFPKQEFLEWVRRHELL